MSNTAIAFVPAPSTKRLDGWKRAGNARHENAVAKWRDIIIEYNEYKGDRKRPNVDLFAVKHGVSCVSVYKWARYFKEEEKKAHADFLKKVADNLVITKSNKNIVIATANDSVSMTVANDISSEKMIEILKYMLTL